MSHELKQRMVDGGLWAAGGRVAAIASSFVLNVVLARSLSPSDYGVYYVVLSTMIILATVGTAGMDRVAVRFIAARKAMGDWADVRAVIGRCLKTVLAATALLCLLFYLLVPWFFNRVLEVPAAVALSGLMVPWLFFSTVQRQLAETFRGLNDIRGATLFGGFRNNGILSSMLTCAAILALWAWGTINLTTVFSTSAGTSLLVLSIAAWTLHRRLRAPMPSPRPDASQGGWTTLRVLHEGWPLWLASLIAVLRAQVSGWFAAGFDSTEQVALFAAADRFALLLTAPLTIVMMLLPPVVAELHARGQTRRMERVVQAVGGLASLPCIVILALIVLAGRQTLGLLFGAHYEAAYPMLIVLCIGQVAAIVTGSWQVVLPMTGLRRQTLHISMWAMSIQAACSVVGGYYAGAFGVAIGASAGAIAGNVLGMLSAHRHLSIWTFVSIRREVLKEATTLLSKRVSGLMQARPQRG